MVDSINTSTAVAYQNIFSSARNLHRLIDENDAETNWPEEVEDAMKFETFFRFDDYRVAAQRADELRASELSNLNLLDRRPLFNNFDPLQVGIHADYVDDSVKTSLADAGWRVESV